MRKRNMKHILWSLYALLYDFIRLFSSNKIFINGYFCRKGPYVLNSNWGDDINISIFSEVTNSIILPKNASRLYRYLPIKNYLCIGSVIGLYDNKKMQIWGSGAISEDSKLTCRVDKIFSVRGPLTREILLRQGIDCPSIYGDPALLVSKVYQPNIGKKYKIGIIPHYKDIDNNCIKEFAYQRKDVIIISMTGYKNWRDIPDLVCSCECIISSSLHGLIVSDSYGIPNVWVKFSELITGGSFKYLDYFKSVGREEQEPIIINSMYDLKMIEANNKYGGAKNIDFKSIYDACPFKERLSIKI